MLQDVPLAKVSGFIHRVDVLKDPAGNEKLKRSRTPIAQIGKVRSPRHCLCPALS
jgi:hypothetical protein